MKTHDLDCQTKDHSEGDLPHPKRDVEHRPDLGRARPQPSSPFGFRTHGSRRTHERATQTERSAWGARKIKDDLS